MCRKALELARFLADNRYCNTWGVTNLYYSVLSGGRDMRRGLFSALITFGAGMALVLGCFLGSSHATVSYAASEPSKDITIVDEYLIPDSIGWCTYYVVVAENTTGSDISISADFVAKDKEGRILRKVNDYSDAVKDGQQFMLYGQFVNSAIRDAASYEYKYSIGTSERCAYSSVSLNAEKDGDLIAVSATNSSKFDVQGVGVRTVFMKDGRAVGFDTVNIADEGYIFHGGSTNSQTIGFNTGSYDNYIMTYTTTGA